MRAIVYIDGFNLCYGLLRHSPHKWLDLEKLPHGEKAHSFEPTDEGDSQQLKRDREQVLLKDMEGV